MIPKYGEELLQIKVWNQRSKNLWKYFNSVLKNYNLNILVIISFLWSISLNIKNSIFTSTREDEPRLRHNCGVERGSWAAKKQHPSGCKINKAVALVHMSGPCSRALDKVLEKKGQKEIERVENRKLNSSVVLNIIIFSNVDDDGGDGIWNRSRLCSKNI